MVLVEQRRRITKTKPSGQRCLSQSDAKTEHSPVYQRYDIVPEKDLTDGVKIYAASLRHAQRL
jgi:hypothetical protein